MKHLASYLRGLDALGAEDVTGPQAPITWYDEQGNWGKALVVLGIVDVDGLIQRFAELAHDNDTARRIWAGHGYDLAARAAKAAQDIIAKAVLPTNEFAWHDQVMAYAARANVLGPKISALPLDSNPCPYWDELESYVVDGSRLVNALDGVLDGSVKWEDVKSAAASAAAGVKGAVDTAQSAAKWTLALAIGGVALIGFGLYKIASGPTGQVAVRTLLR
jgi:hypothetical protein